MSSIRHAARLFVPLLALSALLAACGEDKPKSYDLAAMDASYSGDMKTAIILARKEVARFSTPEQCSPAHNINCGTLALAYGSLAQYQIAAGDRAGGEASLADAKGAMSIMDREHLPATAGVVYRDVSEAFWKAGDKARARAVIEEGRLAGGDTWLVNSSAGREIVKERERERLQREAEAREAEIEAQIEAKHAGKPAPAKAPAASATPATQATPLTPAGLAPSPLR